ncbi:MAG: hypothetical protein HOP15_18270, partial [Planctomycetes bacterium]|nr:hypothetical protein [Planctomycetota bacterium]
MATQIDAVLAEIDLPAHMARAANQLARLGGDAVQPLFDRLRAGQGGVSQRAALLGAIGMLPRQDVLAMLARLARSAAGDAERETGLDLLGRVGARAELKLAIELGIPSDPESQPGPSLRAALASALLGICERERGSVRTLAGFFPRALPSAQTVIATVLARAGGD